MEANLNLKEIEKKTYRSTFQDGLWDILWGLSIIEIGFIPFLKNIGIPRPWNIFLIIPLPFFIYWAGKKYLTIPRTGIVKLGARRDLDKKKMRKLFIIPFLFIAMGIILTFTSTIQQTSLILIFILSGVFILVLQSKKLKFLQFFRVLYPVIVFFIIGWPLAELLYRYVGTPLDGILAFGVTGGIVMSAGLVLLIRFLQKYPVIEGEGNNESQ